MAATELGVDAIGLVFAPNSRRITPCQGRKIAQLLPSHVTCVGVFADADYDEIMCTVEVAGLDAAQLHGNETPELVAHCVSEGLRVIKAFRVRNEEVLAQVTRFRGCGAAAYLLDAYSPHQAGGTGASFDWSIACRARQYGPIVLAGGLTPANVGDAISTVRPVAVDVCSGVENRPGCKSISAIELFMQRVNAGSRKPQSTRRTHNVR